MANDKTKRAPRDGLLINLGDDYEVAYWTKRLGVSNILTRLRFGVGVRAIPCANLRTPPLPRIPPSVAAPMQDPVPLILRLGRANSGRLLSIRVSRFARYKVGHSVCHDGPCHDR
jgi:hypothetical protein